MNLVGEDVPEPKTNESGSRFVSKRMSFSRILQRRMKPLKYASDSEESIISPEDLHTSDVGDQGGDKESHPKDEFVFQSSGEEEATLGNDESGDDSQSVEQDMGDISFGALARAQEGLLGKRSFKTTDDDVDIIPQTNLLFSYTDAEAEERKAGKKDSRDFSRSSKHAPAELSTKKAVSRRREVVQVKKLDHRDPRFEPFSGPIDGAKLKKNYSFLDIYRDSEMAELRAAILNSKNADSLEKLKQALRSMESRKKTDAVKDQEQAVLRVHRAKEKELVKQGKKPFYLKRGERRKLALVERFEGLKERQVDKLIERRRKKKTARERKGMPEGRRM